MSQDIEGGMVFSVDNADNIVAAIQSGDITRHLKVACRPWAGDDRVEVVRGDVLDTDLWATMILGPGSASFEILRYLVLFKGVTHDITIGSSHAYSASE